MLRLGAPFRWLRFAGPVLPVRSDVPFCCSVLLFRFAVAWRSVLVVSDLVVSDLVVSVLLVRFAGSVLLNPFWLAPF